MRLLTIECGNSKLSSLVIDKANELRPHPIVASIIHVNLAKFSQPEFKFLLHSLAPDTIVVNPPAVIPNCSNWNALLEEVIRQASITSGRILFVSSVEVLGDAYTRTEDSPGGADSDYGLFLETAEMKVQAGCAQHYILRLPYTTENSTVKGWVKDSQQTDGRNAIKDNQWFTLINLQDVAKIIVARIQTGLYGVYHATPNDKLALQDLVAMEVPSVRIPDRTLASKYQWPAAPSQRTWDEIKGS